MQEYRIEVKVKNNLFIKRIEQAGYKNLRQFCILNKICQISQLGNIINMKESPLQSNGKWKNVIVQCSEIFGCAPDDFFTDIQLNTILSTNKKFIEVKEAEMKFMLSQQNTDNLLEQIVREQHNTGLDKALSLLTPRARKVIEMRYALGDYSNCHTLEECAEKLDVTRERIRQIECKAMRVLNNHASEYIDIE